MTHACTDQEARAAILEIGRRMFARQYVAANDGNISVRTAPDRIWVTPTGVSKGYMTEDMLLCVDLEGRVLEGTASPSSEMKMHLRVYQENPEVGSVVHAHPPAATSFAIARVPMDMALLTETVFNLGVVPVAPYATPGTQEVPESIAPFCRSHNAVLLANHGALTWGPDLWSAFDRMETVEQTARIYANVQLLGGGVELTEAQETALLGLAGRYAVLAGPRTEEESV